MEHESGPGRTVETGLRAGVPQELKGPKAGPARRYEAALADSGSVQLEAAAMMDLRRVLRQGLRAQQG